MSWSENITSISFKNYVFFLEPTENTIPTVGFNVITLRHKGHPVIVYDLGGGPQIRAIWTSYFVDVSMFSFHLPFKLTDTYCRLSNLFFLLWDIVLDEYERGWV